MNLEPLPNDGARWRCCFTFAGDECNLDAAGALPLSFELPAYAKLIFLRGRAVCAKHARVLEEL